MFAFDSQEDLRQNEGGKKRKKLGLSPAETRVEATCPNLFLLEYYGNTGLKGTTYAAES